MTKIMNLLSLKVLFINICLATSFEHRFLSNWKRLVNKVIDVGGDAVRVDADEKWIEQPLDHFDDSEKRTWQMRYFEDLTMWKSGGPVLLMIGGEDLLEPFRSGLLYELAAETNAAVFFAEHRYYGESIPIRDVSTPNLKYLSSLQAIYDSANLLKFIKSDPKFNSSKIVAFGGSYAGNLAAWIRLLFPQTVDAAVSSSAPVLAKKDYFEYFEVVGAVLSKYGSRQCYESLLKIFTANKDHFKTASGIEWIKKHYNVCPEVDLTRKENMMSFFMRYMNTAAYVVQYAETTKEIQDYCSLIPTLNTTRRCTDCDINKEIDDLKKSDSSRIWLYQTCTEFGYFQTGSDKQPFTDVVTVDYYLALCRGVFGSEFNEQRVDASIAHTNKMYGGLSPKLDKVVFVNGDRDPWAALGITESLSSEAPAVVIENASHCSDYYSIPLTTDARMKWDLVKKTVKSWIGL